MTTVVQAPVPKTTAQRTSSCPRCHHPISVGDEIFKVERRWLCRFCVTFLGLPVVGEEGFELPDPDEVPAIDPADLPPEPDVAELVIFKEFGPVTLGSSKLRYRQSDGGYLTVVIERPGEMPDVHITGVLPSEISRLQDLSNEVLAKAGEPDSEEEAA